MPNWLNTLIDFRAALMKKRPRRRYLYQSGASYQEFASHTSILGMTVLLCSLLLGCDASQQRLEQAVKRVGGANTQEQRFYALGDAAKESFNAGKIEDARNYAQELMRLSPTFQGNWNYGNAVQDVNLVLGRIALKEGHVDEAKRYLLQAGKSPGSPQMNSFGPNMSLAQDLLAKRERDVVLEYFELCRKFWKMENGRLTKWSQEVKAGKIPDLGANLVY